MYDLYLYYYYYYYYKLHFKLLLSGFICSHFHLLNQKENL